MNWEYKLVSVPLMGSNNGNGYWQDYDAATPIAGTKGSQGRPIWAGEGNSFTGGRSSIIGMTSDSPVTTTAGYGFNIGGAAPNATTGSEQYLEVRLAVKTTAAATNPVYEDTPGGDTPGFLSFNTNDDFTSGGTQVGAKSTPIVNPWHHGDIALGYGGCWVYIIGKKHLK
jgi:hypothetical protein